MSTPISLPAPRLAYLVSRYPAISHTFILREVRQLRAQGFDIHVASVNMPDSAPGNLTAEESDETRRTYYIKQAGLFGALRAHLLTILLRPLGYVRGFLFACSLSGLNLKKIVYNFFYFVEAVMIGRWMQDKALSHLHVHFTTPASTAGLIATKTFPFTLSLTVHGPDEFYDAPGYHLSEKIQGASFLCCIGRYARSQLMKLSEYDQWSKFEISPLGVDPGVFTPRPFREHTEPFSILCVGRLTPAKGQHILVAAVDSLVKDGSVVQLRFVGDGPDRQSLEQDVKARGLEAHIVFEGAVNQDRIRTLYEAADVFALASFAEGIPVVLMEAMAMDIPCVTTHITGIPELIREGVDGLLVPPSDECALAGALARLMDDPALRRRLGQAGRLRVLAKYELYHNTERLAQIFQQRLGQLSSSPWAATDMTASGVQSNAEASLVKPCWEEQAA